METKGKTDRELWAALQGLDDDLLDPNLPESAVDAELKALGVDATALARRGSEFVLQVKEEERLSWQARAREQKDQLERLASKSVTRLPAVMSRKQVQDRLEELRTSNAGVGAAIRMAARKRKPEESTDAELRALLEEMEALRSIEDNDEE